MSRGAVAMINLAALQHNFSKVQQYAKNSSILAMIKSNGYGHGALRIAKHLASQIGTVHGFGVACIDEALLLRQAGIKNNIVVTEGFFDSAEIPLLSQYQLISAIHQTEQIDQLEKAKLSAPLAVWLKIDTGMHRLGFSVAKASAAFERLNQLSCIKKPVSVMTHLADADNRDRAFTLAQIQAFQAVTAGWNVPKSIVNSAGIMAYPEAHADWVRPGIMLYGVSPFSDRTGVEEDLQPVMTLTAKIIAVKQCRALDAIGYGCTWRCPEDMLIGIVGIGYGDGYPRHLPNGTPTLVNGKVCPLVGRVSMDMIAIDLRSQPDAVIGDRVTLWGEGLPVEKIALLAGTNGYELLCQVTNRVQFVEQSA